MAPQFLSNPGTEPLVPVLHQVAVSHGRLPVCQLKTNEQVTELIDEETRGVFLGYVVAVSKLIHKGCVKSVGDTSIRGHLHRMVDDMLLCTARFAGILNVQHTDPSVKGRAWNFEHLHRPVASHLARAWCRRSRSRNTRTPMHGWLLRADVLLQSARSRMYASSYTYG